MCDRLGLILVFVTLQAILPVVHSLFPLELAKSVFNVVLSRLFSLALTSNICLVLTKVQIIIIKKRNPIQMCWFTIDEWRLWRATTLVPNARAVVVWFIIMAEEGFIVNDQSSTSHSSRCIWHADHSWVFVCQLLLKACIISEKWLHLVSPTHNPT